MSPQLSQEGRPLLRLFQSDVQLQVVLATPKRLSVHGLFDVLDQADGSCVVCELQEVNSWVRGHTPGGAPVLKVHKRDPRVARRAVEMLQDAGGPAGVLAVQRQKLLPVHPV